MIFSFSVYEMKASFSSERVMSYNTENVYLFRIKWLVQVTKYKRWSYKQVWNKKRVFKAGPRLQGSDEVDVTAWNRSPKVDEAIWLLTDVMMENLSKIIINNLLDSLHKELSEQNKSNFERGCLPGALAAIQESATSALHIVRPSPAQVDMTGLAEH